MVWVLYALLARFLWSWTNISDKLLLNNKVKNPLVYLVVGFLADLAITPIWFFFGFVWYGWFNFWFIVLASILFFVGTFFYILAMQREEVSRINLLWNLMPLHGIWLSWLFLGEVLDLKQLMALVILLIGSILAGLHANRQKEKIKLGSGFWLMLVSTLFFVGCDVTTRYLTKNNVAPLQMAGYQLFIMPALAAIFFLFKKFRIQFVVEKKNYNWLVILALIIIALFSRVGVFLNIKAISFTSHISLIDALEGAQSMMVFSFAMLLTWLVPKYIKEEWDKKNLLLKFAALVLMVGGIVVLNIKW